MFNSYERTSVFEPHDRNVVFLTCLLSPSFSLSVFLPLATISRASTQAKWVSPRTRHPKNNDNYRATVLRRFQLCFRFDSFRTSSICISLAATFARQPCQIWFFTFFRKIYTFQIYTIEVNWNILHFWKISMSPLKNCTRSLLEFQESGNGW